MSRDDFATILRSIRVLCDTSAEDQHVYEPLLQLLEGAEKNADGDVAAAFASVRQRIARLYRSRNVERRRPIIALVGEPLRELERIVSAARAD
jgi:hypothetical protein